MRKFSVIALVLVAVMVVGFLPVNAHAADLSEDDGNVAFIIDGGETLGFPSLENALEAVKGLTGYTIYLAAYDAIANNLTIPKGITVVIVTSSDYEKDNTTTGNNIPDGGAKEDAYATLVIPEGKTLTVEGSLIVAGNQQGSTPRTGFLSGDYGAITLDGNILVNGSLYARGEIDGNGMVTATDGSSVYERFEILDWRGGNASEGAFNRHVFPFNLYQLSGVNTKLVVEAGATLYGQSYIYASSLKTGASVNVPYISNKDSSSGDYDVSGSVLTFASNDEDGKITINNIDNTVTLENAEVETGNISYTVRIFGIPFYQFSSATTDCPFGFNYNTVTFSNSTIDVKTKIKVMPGCTFTVGTGSSLNIASDAAMYFYSEGVYQKAWCNYSGEWGYGNAAVLDATGGTVNNEGILASSSATFDNLLGLGTLTDGGTATVNEVTQSGTTVTVVPVTFYKAVLPTPAE